MKKYIVIALMTLAAFTGCQDFLVEEPILSQSNEMTLGTYDEVSSVFYNSAYSAFRFMTTSSRANSVRTGGPQKP